MITITIANQKGGVGKTTTAVTLAHGLARRNYNVLVIDLDPQGQCAPLLNMSQGKNVFDLLAMDTPLPDVALSTGRNNLWLVPGNKMTYATTAVNTVKGREPKRLLKDAVTTEFVSGQRMHYLILDTAPTVGDLQIGALSAAEILILPCALDRLALEGVKEILDSLDNLGRNEAPMLFVLPTFHDEVTRESRTNLNLLFETFSEAVLPPVHRATILRECAALGRTIFEHAPDSRAAGEYNLLVRRVVDGR